MPKQHFNHTARIAQTATQNIKPNTQAVEFVLPDGIHFDDTIGEHVIVAGGEIVNYAFHWSTAVAQFREASRIRRDHRQRNILNLEPGR